MKDAFERYLLSLRQDRGEKTELSDQGALETLLKAAAGEADPTIRVIHEAKKVRGKGGPDFKVTKAAMILGYVEDKTIGENLDQVLKSDQIARYKQLSNNILLTDYLRFIWIKDGKISGRELIALADDLKGRPKKPREDRVKAVSDLLRGFFSTAPEGIGQSQKHSNSPSAAIFSAIFSMKNCGARKRSTRKAASTAFMTFSAIRFFMS
jgi:hypothetical protein